MNNPPKLSLYHFRGCPYCNRVRVAIEDLGLDVEELDIRQQPEHGKDLQEAMGRGTVPVLRTGSGNDSQWLPESADIVRHLYAEYGDGKTPSPLASKLPQRLGMGIAVVLFLSSLFVPESARVWMVVAAGAAWLLGNLAPVFLK